MTRLGDVFECQITGEWGDECADNGMGTKVLRTTNFTPEGRISYDDVVIRYISEVKAEKKRLHCGDIILEKSGGTEKTPVGRVVFCDESIEDDTYLCNNFTQAMRVNREKAFPRYVFYFMWSLHNSGKTDLLQNKTTGIRNLQVKLYLNTLISFPPLDEQRRIAVVLDKVSDLIAKRRQQLEKLDELVKARFVEMFGEPGTDKFGWGLRKLGDCCEINPKKAQDKRLTLDVEVSFVPMPAVGERGEFDASDIRCYREVRTGFTYFRENDVLFAKITPCMENGKGAIAKGLRNGVGFGSTEFHVMRPVAGVSTSHWLYTMSVLCPFRIEAEANMTGSAGQRRVPASFLKGYLVALPPIERQESFEAFAVQEDKVKCSVQKNLRRLEALKKSLMQRYFE